MLLLESKLALFSYVGGYVPSQEDARYARGFFTLSHSSVPLILHLYYSIDLSIFTPVHLSPSILLYNTLLYLSLSLFTLLYYTYLSIPISHCFSISLYFTLPLHLVLYLTLLHFTSLSLTLLGLWLLFQTRTSLLFLT